MPDRATVRILLSESMGGFNGATELGAHAQVFGPGAGRSHFKAGVTKGAAVRSEGFWGLLVTWIDGDEDLTFELIDDENIELAFIIGGIGDEERAIFKAVNAF